MDMNCKNCGNELRSDATFCTNCGTRIEVEQQEQPVPEQEQPVPEQEQPVPEQEQQEQPASEQEQPATAEQTPPLEQTVQNLPPVSYINHTEQNFNQSPVQQQAQFNRQPQTQFNPQPQAQFINQQPMPQQFNNQQQQFNQSQMQFGYIQTNNPQGMKKKSKTGLIIGLSVGGVFLMAFMLVIGIFIGMGIGAGMGAGFSGGHGGYGEVIPHHRDENPFRDVVGTPVPQPLDPSPTPHVPDSTPTPVPSGTLGETEQELIGMWELDTGEYLWFFTESEFIVFSDNGDGTLKVVALDANETGTGTINNSNHLIVESEWGSVYEFIITINADTLVITDDYGDTSFYKKKN